MTRLRAFLCLLVMLVVMPQMAWAQAARPQQPTETPLATDTPPPVEEIPPERIELGLSKDVISITSDFSGEDLTIFGAVDNIDPLIQRQGRYDVFVILEGPAANVVARRKGRKFGIWMNISQQPFSSIPQSYLVSSTRLPRDITNLNTLARLSLGVGQIRLQASKEVPVSPQLDDYVEALRRIKAEAGLFQGFPGGVQFISQTLFRADLRLPANVPLGTHKARAYLFRNGELTAQTQSSLAIRKAGLEFQLYDLAHNSALIYGFACVLLALVVGWLGRVIFRRD